MVVHLNVLGPCVQNRSLSSRFNHMASQVARAAPRYLASVLDSATVGFFLLLHAIAALPRENAYPNVDRQSAIGGVASPMNIGRADQMRGCTGLI